MPDNTLNPVVGIDLGTTFSCIARWEGDRPEVYKLLDGNETLPSIVHIQDKGIPLVGKFARPKLLIDPENTVEKVKRFMGDDSKTFSLRGQSYTPVAVSTLILERLVNDVRKRFPESAGFEIAGAIVTHPQYFKYPQIARTQEAAEKAGLPILRLVSEPVAAALDYGFLSHGRLNKDSKEKILVFDLGGGTFDVTIIEVISEKEKLTFNVLSTGGDDMLGGTNFDEAFAEWILKEQKINLESLDKPARDRAMANLLEKIIESKITLSNLEEVYLAVPNILPGQHLDIEVTRTQFEQVIQPYCDRIRNIISNTMSNARVRAGELNKTILVGGSSRIPIMKRIVHEETGSEPWADADPDLAVCRGAAFLAAMDDGRIDKREVVVQEATSHALGVRAAGDKFSILIPANRPAPAEATRIYTTTSPEIIVEPYQGHGRFVTDSTVTALKPIPITGIQLGPNKTADVKITFTVNDQQLLFVKIEAPGVSEQRQMDF